MQNRFPSLRAAVLASTAGCALAVSLAAATPARAEAPARAMITKAIDESKTVTMSGNIRPEVAQARDMGKLADSYAFPHLYLQLQRSPEREAAAEQYIADIHDRHSPLFHRWLSQPEINSTFGVAGEDMAKIVHWLAGHGFKVNGFTANMVLDVSGTAGGLRSAFGMDVHAIQVHGENHIANVTDPRVPEALAAVLLGPPALHDFKAHPLAKRRAQYTFSTGGNTYEAVVPDDLHTIYNFNPLYAAGLDGSGQTIVVTEESGLYTTGDWYAFRKVLGLSRQFPKGTLTVESPGSGCTNPGDAGSTDAEVAIDVEWASAAAPNANIVMAACKNTTQYGFFIALQNILAQQNHPNVFSISYGYSEPLDGATENAYVNTLYQTAVMEGVSVFVSSGDEGAASSDANKTSATHGISVSGWTSTPYNISVGGTDYEDTLLGENSKYWSATNNQNFGSALSYIPEIPWIDSCASGLIYPGLGFSSPGAACNNATVQSEGFLTTASGSGGPSGCATGTASVRGVVSGTCKPYAKPTWQSGLVGNPADGVRDIPDVSGFAANGVFGHYYIVCYSHAAYGGTPCNNTPSTWAGFGGTSVSSPIMAATQALINQRTGQSWGNANTVYYAIAKSLYGKSGNANCASNAAGGPSSSCDFHDITVGDMDVDCRANGSTLYNCYRPSGTYGALSLSNTALQPAYGTSTGWDFPTGIGTVNAATLVNDPAW